MKLTVDANLYVARFRSEESTHAEAHAFFGRCRKLSTLLYAPVVLLGEVAGALARLRGNSAFGDAAVVRILADSRVRLRQIDLDFARTSARFAARYRLKGADALYLAVAHDTNSTLITWDAELLQTESAVKVITPSQWLSENL